MKGRILTLAFILASTVCFAQSKVEVKKEGNTFVATKTTNSSYIPTKYSYRDTDGMTYQIFVHTTKKGETKCYIKKISKKTGNEYWKEIPVKPEDVK